MGKLPSDKKVVIWEGIQTGVFQTFSSDHCSFFYEGSLGKLNPKARTSFKWVLNGIPGVETRLQILFSKGVVEGRISLNQFVAMTSTNHAKCTGSTLKKDRSRPGLTLILYCGIPTAGKPYGRN